jgi:YrbI family 3-deoxy-D-manno-octulosonate 8-phosphate phosphatase
VYCGTRPKIEVAEEWLAEMGLSLQQMAFIGDDLNDLPLLRKAGFSACPADAASQVKAAVHLVLSRKGGEGCVREFIEEVLGADLL